MQIVLYGSYTSPYVRRVRVLARELGLSYTLVNTAEAAGQAALRAASPVWKVPAAEIDGELVLDSARITEALMRAAGPGPLRLVQGPHRRHEENLIVVVDAVLDGLIRRFYAVRDGLDPEAWPQLVKERERARACMEHLAGQLDGGGLRGLSGVGRAEIALATALGWMRLRGTFPIDELPEFVAFEAAWAARPSMLATAPV